MVFPWKSQSRLYLPLNILYYKIKVRSSMSVFMLYKNQWEFKQRAFTFAFLQNYDRADTNFIIYIGIHFTNHWKTLYTIYKRQAFKNFDSLLKFNIDFIQTENEFGIHAMKHIIFNMLMQLKGKCFSKFMYVCVCVRDEGEI